MLLSVTYVCFSKRFVTFQVVNIFRLPKLPNITWATVAELIIIKQNTNASFIQPSLSRSPSLVHFQPLSSCDFFCWQNYYHWAPVGFEQKSTTLKENVFGAVTHYMQFQTHSNSNNIDSYYSQKYSHYICLNFEKESANTTIVEHKKKYFVNCHYYYYYKNVFCLSYSYLSYLSYLSSSFSSFFLCCRIFSWDICDNAVSRSCTEFWRLRWGICSRRWALRRAGSCAGRRWWCVSWS